MAGENRGGCIRRNSALPRLWTRGIVLPEFRGMETEMRNADMTSPFGKLDNEDKRTAAARRERRAWGVNYLLIIASFALIAGVVFAIIGR